MHDAERADFSAVEHHGVEVDGMLIGMGRLRLFVRKRQVLEVVREDSEHIAQLEIEVAHVLGLAVERDSELLVLDAEVVLVHTVNDSADLEDAKRGRVADVRLDLTELCRDHGAADGFDVGVGGVGELDVLLDGNAERLLLVVIRPDVGMNLVEVVSLDEDILDFLLVALDDVRADGIER